VDMEHRSPPAAPQLAVDDGVLHTTPGRGVPTYLLTRDSFRDFELSFEWKCDLGANSGVKYRFQGYWVQGQARADPRQKKELGLPGSASNHPRS
jgi:hypothetical protein